MNAESEVCVYSQLKSQTGLKCESSIRIAETRNQLLLQTTSIRNFFSKNGYGLKLIMSITATFDFCLTSLVPVSTIHSLYKLQTTELLDDCGCDEV